MIGSVDTYVRAHEDTMRNAKYSGSIHNITVSDKYYNPSSTVMSQSQQICFLFYCVVYFTMLEDNRMTHE